MSRFKPRTPKWPWRDFLTEAERNVLARADAAKAEWKRLNAERAGIANRALQRAKAAAGREQDHG